MFKTKIILIAIIFIITDVSLALSGDEKQPMRLVSDSAICKRQNNENICTYLGNAKLNQGTTSLQAHQIVVHKKAGNKINKIVALGRHSYYRTVLDNKQKVIADADRITIYLDENVMVLEGNGQAIVGKDKYSGPYIKYRLK